MDFKEEALKEFFEYFFKEDYKSMGEFYLQNIDRLPNITSIIYSLSTPYNIKMLEYFLFNPEMNSIFENLRNVFEKNTINPTIGYCRILDINKLSLLKNSNFNRNENSENNVKN